MKRTFVTSIVLTVPVALSVIVYLAESVYTHTHTHTHTYMEFALSQTKDILAEFSINQMNVLNIVLCAWIMCYSIPAQIIRILFRVHLSRVVILGVPRGFCARGIYLRATSDGIKYVPSTT